MTQTAKETINYICNRTSKHKLLPFGNIFIIVVSAIFLHHNLIEKIYWVAKMPIIEPGPTNPFVDGRQSPSALMIRQGVERQMLKSGFSCLAELTLATGRRCDLICLSSKGEIIIVEVKSSIEDYRVDKKWPEYQEYCDAFYFATHAGVAAEIFPKDEGLYLADAYGAEIIRPARENKIPAATRKSLLLRFASVASQRLRIVSSFAEKAGISVDYSNME